MSVKPRDLLSAAVEIKQLSTEAAFRASASRAYYACYHYSKDLADLQDRSGGTGMHERHISKFTNSVNGRVRGMGYVLQQLHGTRIDADYEIEDDFDASDAEEAIRTSERIMELIDECS